jgi:hypothetical protein
MGPETEMEGNLELMRKYGRFFFIGSEKNESDPGDAPWMPPGSGLDFRHLVKINISSIVA